MDRAPNGDLVFACTRWENDGMKSFSWFLLKVFNPRNERWKPCRCGLCRVVDGLFLGTTSWVRGRSWKYLLLIKCLTSHCNSIELQCAPLSLLGHRRWKLEWHRQIRSCLKYPLRHLVGTTMTWWDFPRRSHEKSCKKSHIHPRCWFFHPDPWGRFPFWRTYFFRWVVSTPNGRRSGPMAAVVDPETLELKRELRPNGAATWTYGGCTKDLEFSLRIRLYVRHGRDT